MSSSATLQEIREGARRRADQVNSDFRSDADVDKLVNQTWNEVYEHIIMQQAERYLGSETFTTDPGISVYGLPADFYKAKSVDVVVGSRTRTMDMFQWQNRNRYQDGIGWSFDSPMAWRLYGDNIVFTPTPTAVHSVTLWYHPTPPSMASDSDTLDGVVGWDEAVLVGTAWKLALEEGDIELASSL